MTDETTGAWISDRGNSEIDVLLVDDNEQWAELVRQDIERAAGDVSVTIALNANEAMTALQEDDSVDCVVADYQMPEVDGIELLDRVRAEWPELPFILMTGEGNEDVASRAIDAGVSDYIIKNPRTDQTAAFTSKIESAVEQHRLRQAIAESEERYRTVTEQSHDAIAILRDTDDLVFCNERLAELTGFDQSALLEMDMLTEIVHPEDRDDVREIVGRWQRDEPGEHLHEARIVTADGSVRHCEFTGRGITYEGRASTLVSIRDVTERKLRERELEWERQFNRTVQRALVDSRTRDQLEEAIADQLAAYGYPLVWFGGIGESSVDRRTVVGEESYLDTIADCIDDEGHDSEPSVWAIRSGEPKFVRDFTDLFGTAWRDAALERDLRSGAAMPLVYDDIFYGVLAVYDDEVDGFDEVQRKLLTDLSEMVAFAIHHIETKRALTADSIVRVELQVSGGSYYLTDLANTLELRASDSQLTVHGTLPRGEDDTIQFVSLEGVDVGRFRELANEQAAIKDVQPIGDTADPDGDRRNRLRIATDSPTPEARLSALGALVRATTIRPDGAILDLEVPATGDLREIVESLEDAFGPVSVLSRTETEINALPEAKQVPVDLDQLTDKQAEALQAAFHHGYFEQPRRNSASEVAESLGVAHSTFLQHLRAAQRKVLDDFYG